MKLSLILLSLLAGANAFASSSQRYSLVSQQMSEPAMACHPILQVDIADDQSAVVSLVNDRGTVIALDRFSNRGVTCQKVGSEDFSAGGYVCQSQTLSNDLYELATCESRGMFAHQCSPSKTSGAYNTLRIDGSSLQYTTQARGRVNWQTCSYSAE
jgi:hypothetical protein